MAKTALLLDDAVDLLPHLELQAEVLGDRLDHQVAVGEVGVVERALDAAADGVGVAPARACPSRPRARAASRSCPIPLSSFSCVDLAQDDLVARLRRHLGDSVAHQAAAQHSHLLDLHSLPPVSVVERREPICRCRNRGSRSGPPRRPAARREAQRVQRRADPGAGRRRSRTPRPTTTSACVVVRGDGPDVLLGHGPERPARPRRRTPSGLRALPPADPQLVEPARGDAQADDLPDPRRVPRRRVRAGARAPTSA